MTTTIELLQTQKNPTEKLGLYIHIPFCKKKCRYCDFFSIPVNNGVPDEYIHALLAELGDLPYKHTLKSIYIGGGTPSLLNIKQIEKIARHVNKLFKSDKPEFSIEVNPDDITEDWVKELKGVSINRISIGVQSFFDTELQYLGRRHDASKAKLACEIIAKHFDNWSLDLIFGIPVSTAKKWEENLSIALNLSPSHISTYNLTYEPGTPLYKNNLKEKNDDDTCLELYKIAEKYLVEKGFEHYEISNFAKQGYKCIHNLIYWHNETYIGIGAGAFSYVGNLRCMNIPNIKEYLKFPGKKFEEDYLTKNEVKVETLIQYFRLSDGIDEKTYFERFHSTLENDFGPALYKLTNRGLLEYNKGVYKPTNQGFYLNNEIGIELLLCIDKDNKL